MTAEPSASIWEVTRLILDSPDRSPSEIAHEHGYTAAEIAELMPIFLDTARTDWSVAADTATDWATPAVPDAELYLRDLAGSGSIEVAGFDAAPDADVPDTSRIPSRTPMTAATWPPARSRAGRRPASRCRPISATCSTAPARGCPSAPPPTARPASPARSPTAWAARRPSWTAPRPSSTAPPGGGPDGALPVDGEVTGPPTPDDGFELGEDDPFETGPYADEPLGDPTGPDLPDEPSDAGFDDAAGGAYSG